MKNNNLLAASAVLALASTLVCSAPAQYQLLLSGPVEAVDHAKNSVTVLGHRLVVQDASAILLGHLVNVFGGFENSSAKAAIVQDTSVFAASGDSVLLIGVVNAIDKSRGRVMVDGASVDYTALLAQPRFSLPAVGSSVRVIGTQPSGRGTVLAGAIVRIGSAGVSSGGNGLGVSSGGNGLGVSSGGNGLGVSSGGNGLGVSSGGNGLGVSSGGNGLGVSSGGNGLGVSSGGAPAT